MKRLDFYYFLTIALVGACLLWSQKKIKHVHIPPTPPSAVTTQQRASHWLHFVDENGSIMGSCSSTAIGPNAFLTATHCFEESQVKDVQFDWSMETHTVLSFATDGRDHIIAIVDGTPFKNYEHLIAWTSQRVLENVPGETVTMYGDGLNVYPPLPKYGHITDCEDPSDIDLSAGLECYTLNIKPGDSGAAVYNTQGEVIGLVTYVLEQGTDKQSTGMGFALSFTQAQYDKAFTFTTKGEK